MKEFIDKTFEKSGTPLNRNNLMALQGFISATIVFNDDDGSITEINENGEVKKTIFNDDGSITEMFMGEKIISKTTTMNDNGSISEIKTEIQ